jgi:predicted GNAT superfamily acetyltransferase
VTTAGRSAQIVLRCLSSIDEYRACEELQARVWGRDDVGCVSALVMITAQENGGLTVGAFAGDRLVGFVHSFLGLTETGTLKHCSVLLAVDPELRNSGIGYHLKLMQREMALRQGVDLITWTFDPLASPNANLNISKLGCVCSRYLFNHYGTFTGGLNAGLATDRFLAEWWIREPRVIDRLRGIGREMPVDLLRANEVAPHHRSGLPVPRWGPLDCEEPALALEIPADFQALKRVDMSLAQAWLEGLRAFLPHYFSRGYRVCGFGPLQGGGGLRRGYWLQREEIS